MPTPVRVSIGDREFRARFDDSATAQQLIALLPLRGNVRRSGDEVAIETAFVGSLEPTARNRLRVGEIAYWPPGQTVSFFCGPTPLSPGDSDHPIAASAVNPIGEIDDPVEFAACAAPGLELRVELA